MYIYLWIDYPKLGYFPMVSYDIGRNRKLIFIDFSVLSDKKAMFIQTFDRF